MTYDAISSWPSANRWPAATIGPHPAAVWRIPTRVGVIYLCGLVEQRAPVGGEVPSLINPPTGCTFRPG